MAINEQATRDATSKAPVLVYSVNQDGWPTAAAAARSRCAHAAAADAAAAATTAAAAAHRRARGVPLPHRGRGRRRRRRRCRCRRRCSGRLGRPRCPLWDRSLHRGSKENKRPPRLWSPPAALHKSGHGLALGTRKPASGGRLVASKGRKPGLGIALGSGKSQPLRTLCFLSRAID